MKKILSSIIGSALVLTVVTTTLMTGGCKIEPEQAKVIAQSAGLFSAVGWIAMDNPDADTIKAAKGLLAVIEDKAADVEGGATYTQVVYPEVEKVIESDAVKPQYRPACKAAAISLLGGLDLLFAAHPEWRKSQDMVVQVVDAFIVGAKNGLSLSEKDELMMTARGTATRRARALNRIQ